MATKVSGETIKKIASMGQKEALRRYNAGQGDEEFKEGVRRYYSGKRIEASKQAGAKAAQSETEKLASRPSATSVGPTSKSSVPTQAAVGRRLESSGRNKPSTTEQALGRRNVETISRTVKPVGKAVGGAYTVPQLKGARKSIGKFWEKNVGKGLRKSFR
jgi:hypothetical protein